MVVLTREGVFAFQDDGLQTLNKKEEGETEDLRKSRAILVYGGNMRGSELRSSSSQWTFLDRSVTQFPGSNASIE